MKEKDAGTTTLLTQWSGFPSATLSVLFLNNNTGLLASALKLLFHYLVRRVRLLEETIVRVKVSGVKVKTSAPPVHFSAVENGSKKK